MDNILFEPNIVLNGGAENGLTNWTATNVTAVSGGTLGAYAFELIANATLSQTINVTASDARRVGIYATYELENPDERSDVFMHVKLTYESGNFDRFLMPLNNTYAKTWTGSVGTVTSNWEELSTIVNVAEGERVASVFVEAYTTGNLVGKARVDEIKVQRETLADSTLDPGSVGTDHLADGAVTGIKVATAAIDTAHIANLAVGSAQISDLAVTNAKMANLSVTAAKIADLAVTSAKIADLAVTTAKIGDAQITNAKIDRASVDKLVVTTADIANASITTAKIENGAITTALIANAAIETAQLADASITDAKIVSLTANKLTAGTIDASKINVTNLVADNIVTGTITIASANIIRNSSFSEDFSHWIRVWYTNNQSIDTTGGINNGKALKLSIASTSTDPYTGLQSQMLPLAPTQSITVTAKVKVTTAISDGFYINGYWYDSAGAVTTSAKGTSKVSIVGDYVLISQTWTGKVGSSQIKIAPIMYGTGECLVDEVMVQYGKVSTEWQPHTNELLADKGITNVQIGDSAVDNRVITANTITGDRLVIDSITAREVKAREITANHMALNTITAASGVIADLAITNAMIANATITDAKIDNIDASKIKTGLLDAARVVIGSTSTYASGYDPSTKETPTGAQTKADTAETNAKTYVDNNTGNLLNNTTKSGTIEKWQTGSWPTVVDKDFQGTIVPVQQIYTSGDVQVLSDFFDVDPSKAYEVTLWFMADGTGGTDYFGLHVYDDAGSNIGIHMISDSTGSDSTTANTNPYFWSGDNSPLNTWIRRTAYIMPAGTNASDMKDIGQNIYSNARMLPSAAKIRIRWLNYYNAGVAKNVWVANPKVVEVDPNAILRHSIVRSDLKLTAPLPTSLVLDSNGITANTNTSGKYARLDYRGIYIAGGAIQIDGGLADTNIASSGTWNKQGTYIDANGIYTGNLTADQIKTGRLNVQGNQIALGTDFRKDTGLYAEFISTVSGAVSYGTTHNVHGDYLGITNSATTEGYIWSKRFPIVPGAKFTFSYEFYADIELKADYAQVYVLPSTSAISQGNKTSTQYNYVHNASSSAGTGAWHRVEVRGTFANDARSAILRFDHNGVTGTTARSIRYRNVMLNYGDIAMGWQPHPDEDLTVGLITANSAIIDAIDASKITVSGANVSNSNIAAGKTVTFNADGTTGTSSIPSDGNKTVQGGGYLSFGTGTQNNNNGEQDYVQYDLGSNYRIAESKVYFYGMDSRSYWYKVAYSTDNANWHYAVGSKDNNGWVLSPLSDKMKTGDLFPTVDSFPIPIVARYIRLYANGNTVNTANHIYEWELFSSAQTIIEGDRIKTGRLDTAYLTVGSTNATRLEMDADDIFFYVAGTNVGKLTSFDYGAGDKRIGLQATAAGGHVYLLAGDSYDNVVSTSTKGAEFVAFEDGFASIGVITPSGKGVYNFFHDKMHLNGLDLNSPGGNLRVNTGNGYGEIGPQNTTYNHIYTDRTYQAINKEIQLIDENIRGYNGFLRITNPTGSGKFSILDAYGSGSTGTEPTFRPDTDSFGFLGHGNYRWYRAYSLAFYTSSSKKEKKNLKVIGLDEQLTDRKDGLKKKSKDIIKGLDVYSYNRRKKGDHQLGIVAEDAPLEIMDETKENIDIYSYSTLILSGLKDALEEIDLLKDEIALLKKGGIK
jgi:hypothetical protein